MMDRDQRARETAFNDGDYAGMGNARAGFEAHVSQDFCNPCRGVELAIAEFGVFVEPAAPFDYLGLDC